MAHKKGAGSSRNGRESESKRLGVKIYGGQYAKAGNIIVRQRGTQHNPGENVGIGKDHTLFALIEGTVMFKKKRKNRSYVSIEPIVNGEAADAEAPVAATKAEPAKAEKAEAKTEKKAPESDVAEADDLKKIEGIGPKLEEVFNEAGINTYADLASASLEKLNTILEDAGSRYASKDPAPWIEQAKELAGK